MDANKAIANIESRFFRTEHDTGANQQVSMVWNAFRREMGLDAVRLPTWCKQCNVYHLDHCKSNS